MTLTVDIAKLPTLLNAFRLSTADRLWHLFRLTCGQGGMVAREILPDEGMVQGRRRGGVIEVDEVLQEAYAVSPVCPRSVISTTVGPAVGQLMAPNRRKPTYFGWAISLDE
jgi:hypothetical protein